MELLFNTATSKRYLIQFSLQILYHLKFVNANGSQYFLYMVETL